MTVKDFFSPRQVYIGTFVGGPLAAAYYLSRNFIEMDKRGLANLSNIVGLVFTVLLFWGTFLLPEDFPNTVIPAAYAAVAAGIVWHWQVSKEEVEAVESYSFQSNWKVAGVSITALIITMAALVGVFMLLPVA